MERKNFLKAMAFVPLASKAMQLQELSKMSESFARTERMPVLFIGHGNPMNAILDNPFTRRLREIGERITQKPNAILVVSAHWLTGGSFVSITPKPEVIYDFEGFPPELYKVTYAAVGAPAYAQEVTRLATVVKDDKEWGLDHGAWSILKHLYPAADAPVFEMSIDYYKPMQYHFELAQLLKPLRDKGVLIIGSGNIVHNLRLYFSKPDETPFDWAVQFDGWVKDRITARDFKALVDYDRQGAVAKLAVPTVDHYVPMLYSIAVADKSEDIKFIYEENISAISMRAFKIG